MTRTADTSSRRPADLLLALGVVHLLSAPLLQPGLRPLIRDGLIGAVRDDASRESAVWFVVSGLGLVALADTGRSHHQQHGRLPARYGAWVLAAGAVVTAALPASPGWLVMAAGVMAVRSERPTARRTSRPGLPKWWRCS